MAQRVRPRACSVLEEAEALRRSARSATRFDVGQGGANFLGLGLLHQRGRKRSEGGFAMAGGTTAPGAAIGSATRSASAIAALAQGLPAVAHGRRSRRARFLRRLLGVSLTAVVVALFAGAGSAAAGTYSVYADFNNNQAWAAKSGARGNLVAYTDCNASA